MEIPMHYKATSAVWTRVILGALLLAAGFRNSAAAQGLRSVDSVAAVVNGEIITNEELRSSAKLALDALKEQYTGSELEAHARAVLSSRLTQLVEKKLLLHEAKLAMTKEEIKKEQVDKDLDRVLKDLIGQAGSLLQLKKLLASKGETIEQAKERRREELLIEEILRRNVLPFVSVSPREIRDFYRSHMDAFTQKKQVKFRQIFIKFSEYETKEQARQVADSVLKKLQAGGSFETLAQENSRDPYAKEGGLWANGEFIAKGTVLHDIDEVIFKLRVNELSPVVESSQGYHILRVDEIKPERVVPFDEAQDQIRRHLAEERWTKRYNEYIAELRTRAYIEMR
jgi:parvulin-like peptidyl-prolyl isomerase